MYCIEEDCDEPRHKTNPRCEGCYKDFERERKRKQRQKKEASPTLEELYDAPQQEARERHARRAGEEEAFRMEASIYGYQQAPPQPTIMERLGNRLMQALGLDDPPAPPPPPPQQEHFIPISSSSTQSGQLVMSSSGQVVVPKGFSTPDSKVSSGSSTPNPYHDMPPSNVNMLYNGVEEMDDGNIRDEQSVLILGEPGEGKSYLARYVIEGMHRRNHYKHLVLITSSSTYFNTKNALRSVARIEQVILWDCLKDKKEKTLVQKRLLESIKLWKQEGTTQQSMIVFDDVSQQMEQGEFTSLENLFMNGYHERVDVVVIYHNFPLSTQQSLKTIRSNVKCIFLTGTTHIDNTYKLSGWVDKGGYTKAEFTDYAQSFIKHRARCGLILKRLKTETPLQEHFVPFRAFLGKNYNTSTDEGLVGDENDATSIIEDTGAETEVYLMLTAYIEREEAKLQIKKEELQNYKPAGSAKKKVKKEKSTATTASGRKVKVKREKLDDDSSVDSFIDSDDN